MYLKWNTKDEWVASVKVGDIICTCKYEHLEVKEIIEPSTEELCERMVVLENGNLCSLINCADAVPHPENCEGERGK